MSEFFDSKDDMIEPICEKLALMKQHGVTMTHLRLDNALENKALQKMCQKEKWQLGIHLNSLHEILLSRIPSLKSDLLPS